MHKVNLGLRMDASFDPAHTIKHNVERPLGSEFGIELFERTGRRVARIRESFLASRFSFGVQSLNPARVM